MVDEFSRPLLELPSEFWAYEDDSRTLSIRSSVAEMVLCSVELSVLRGAVCGAAHRESEHPPTKTGETGIGRVFLSITVAVIALRRRQCINS